MLPDEEIRSSEIIRPFVIMQPQCKVYGENKSKKKGSNFNPRVDPPNSQDFFREMNKSALDHYKEKLALSESLKSVMQNRSSVYLNFKDDDTEYKSLYGEKNPQMENNQNKEKYLNLLQNYKVSYHLKRTSKIRA